MWVLGYPLLLVVGLVSEQTGATVFLAPLLCASLVAYVLLASRKVLREELSHKDEFGVYFARGEVGSTISYVSFGEYSGATYSGHPTKRMLFNSSRDCGHGSGLALMGWPILERT